MIIRKAIQGDATGIAHVHVKSWQTTYKGIVSDEVLNNLSFERRRDTWESVIANPKANEFNYVAINDEGEIVGFASGGISRSDEYEYDGELYAIYILEEYQRMGLGRQLISKIAYDLIQLGYKSMIVWVLDDNPSKKAYEKLGGVAFDSTQIKIGEQTLDEVVLVWKDISVLLL